MNISFEEVIRPEGKQEFVLQAYCIYDRVIPDITAEIKRWWSMPCSIFDLTGELKSVTTIEVEVATGSIIEFGRIAIQILVEAVAPNRAERCIMMFDGAYGGLNMILADEIINQIYGFSSRVSGPVLCLNMKTLKSEQWRSVIQSVR